MHTKRDARLPVRPFESFDIGARTVNAAAWICSKCILPMKPLFIYAVSALVVMTAESGAPGLPVEKGTVPANDRYRKKSYAISLRWHYPNQVPGLDDTVHSQPAKNQLPFFFLFQHCKTFRDMCQDIGTVIGPIGNGSMLIGSMIFSLFFSADKDI